MDLLEKFKSILIVVVILRDLLDQFAAFLISSPVIAVLDQLCDIEMLDLEAFFVEFIGSHLG